MSKPVNGPGSSVLAFLIADIRGYTSFTRAHGDEAAAHLAAIFAELAREGVEAHDGTVIELRGDEALATFSSPRQALRAAVELHAVLADEATITDLPLHVGIGLDIGEAVSVEGGYRGDALNFAARLCGVAAGGETLVSDGMRQVVGEMDGVSIEPVDALVLKGIETPVRAGRVCAADPAAMRLVARPAGKSMVPVELDPITPIFGRDSDARRLRWAWRRARAGRGSAVVITGPTGIGKTRLAAEPVSVASQNGALIAYGSALGGGVSSALARLHDAAAVATVVAIDDLESASEDDLNAVREAAARTPLNPFLLVVAATDDARPEVAGVLRAIADDRHTIRLGPIGQEAVAEIVATYAPDARHSAPVWAIAEASAGRPAVVHELAATWARQEVGRRLGDAVERTVSGRRDLRRFESEVASSVVDLQLARTRLNLTARGGQRTAADQCPFMGLVGFDVGDADLFFGRERLVAEMTGRLAGSSFLGVVGPSGSGKSSAVRAGLIPALSSGALPGTERWTRVVLRPGAHPLAELDRVLYAALPPDLRERYSAAVTEDRAGDPLSVTAALLPTSARPLIVIDQFEEIFTTTDAPERDRFVAVIERAARDGYATVVAAIRADLYGRCADYPVLAELLSTGHVLVGAMSGVEYRRAIEGPARRASLAIDNALVDALVDEVLEQPGALPLLSTALVELWERRQGRAIRLTAYAATGGVRGAVARLAEATYGGLDIGQQQIARGLFIRLASGEGDTVVRRRASLAELDAVQNPQVAEVIRTLIEARLLTVGEGSIEVAHEALLREWPRLAEWLEDDRAGRQLREHLTSTAREWQARDHDPAELYRGARLSTAIDWTSQHTLELTETERSFINESRQAATRESERQRRTNRRLRALLAGAGLALVVAVGTGAVAFLQGQAATQAATVADAQRLGAKALIEPNLDVSLLLAREGVALDDDSTTRTDLLSAIVRSPSAIGGWRLPISGRPLNVSVSPDGKDLLVRNDRDEVALIDSATGNLIRDLGSGRVDFFATDGSIVQISGPAGSSLVTVTGVNDTTPRLRIPVNSFSNFSISPDATTLATIDDDRHGITLTDTATLAASGHIDASPNTTVLDVWQYGNGGVLGVVHEGIITDPEALDAYGGPVLLEWWPPGASKPTTAIPSTGDADGAWAIDPAATEIAVPETGDYEAIYDLSTGKRHPAAANHRSIIGMTFTPDGRTLVTSGDDRLLDVWDVNSGQLLDTLAGHAGRVFSPAISDVGGHLTAWSVGLDGQLIEWDLTGDRGDRPATVGRSPCCARRIARSDDRRQP